MTGNEYQEVALKIYERVIESEEEFIFETITPYCETILSKKIGKEELKEMLMSCQKRSLTGNEYQKLAARTIRKYMSRKEQSKHALYGIVGEIGELHSFYQEKYQGRPFDEEHAKKELGDLLWFVAEYCTAQDWKLEDIMQMNIDKLKARYPEGFEAEKSLHRKEGDI